VGNQELARVTAEQEAVANKIKSGATVEEAIEELDADPSRKLHGTAALQAWMQKLSDRAIDELAKTHFDIAPELRAPRMLHCPDPKRRNLLHRPERRFRAGKNVVVGAGRR
jgi:uncharacterized protein (DUF885 family)